MCGRSHGSTVGWKIKEGNTDFAVFSRCSPQFHQFVDAISQSINALNLGAHIKGTLGILSITTTEDHGTCCTIELRNRNHNGGFDGHKSHRRVAPLINALELECLHRKIGHVELSQHGLCSVRIVVSRPANE